MMRPWTPYVEFFFSFSPRVCCAGSQRQGRSHLAVPRTVWHDNPLTIWRNDACKAQVFRQHIDARLQILCRTLSQLLSWGITLCILSNSTAYMAFEKEPHFYLNPPTTVQLTTNDVESKTWLVVKWRGDPSIFSLYVCEWWLLLLFHFFSLAVLQEMEIVKYFIERNLP